MTNQEWLPEEVEQLQRIVHSVVAKGGTKTQAFKQFARINRIRTETAARYKWITISSESESGSPLALNVEPTVENGAAALKMGYDRYSISDNLTEALHKYEKLRNELTQLTNHMKRLKQENEELRRENDQFVRAFQLARQHLAVNSFSQHNNYVVRVGRDGFVESVSAKC